MEFKLIKNNLSIRKNEMFNIEKPKCFLNINIQ